MMGTTIRFSSATTPLLLMSKRHYIYEARLYRRQRAFVRISPYSILGNGYLLILLRSDNRPGLDNLSAVLYSTDSNMVTSKIENMGVLKLLGSQGIAVKSTDNGFQIRLVREWLQDTGADSIEIAIEDWMNLQIEDNRLTASWN